MKAGLSRAALIEAMRFETALEHWLRSSTLSAGETCPITAYIRWSVGGVAIALIVGCPRSRLSACTAAIGWFVKDTSGSLGLY